MSQPCRPTFRGIAAASGWLLLSIVAGASEPLFYEADGGTIVFTNQQSVGARVVPGFAETGGAGTKVALPSTIFDPYIERVARDNGLSPDLIKAVALVESGFDTHAVSSAGAQGLMQLMPQTARQYGVDDAFDPLANLQAGARHLRKLLDRFDGDLVLALAAYNAGEGAVRRHNGVPDYAETVNYVRKVHERLGRRPPAGFASSGTTARARRPVSFRTLDDGSILLSNEP